MGRSIVYCATCGNKILDKDFDSRAAFHLDGRGFCKKCAPNALKSLPPDKMAELLAQISEAESSAKRKTAPPRSPAPAPVTPRHAPQESRTPLIAGLGVAGVVVVVLLAVILSRSDPPPAPPPAPPPKVVEQSPKVDREELAARALQKAREFRDTHPKELATQLASFQRILDEHPGSRAAGEARRELEDTRRRGAEALDAELKVLQDQARASSGAEEFQKAIQALTDARGKHPETSWGQGIDGAIAEIRAAAHKLFPVLKEQALAQRRAGDAAGVQTAKERVAKWGFPEYVSGLEAALAAVPVSTKRALINGKDTSGWTVTRGKWAFKDGTLQAIELENNEATFIMTNEILGDFELEGMIEVPTVRTYTEFNARGRDRTVSVFLEPGWHTFRVVAAGLDVKLFLDDKPIGLSAGSLRQGQFGIYTLGIVRLKDVTIRP